MNSPEAITEVGIVLIWSQEVPGYSPSGGGTPSDRLNSGSPRAMSPRKLDMSLNRQTMQAVKQPKNQKVGPNQVTISA